VLAVPGNRSLPSEPAGGLRFTLYLLPGPSGIRVLDSHTGVPDVLIRGTPLALARQALNGGRTATNSGVEVQGDVQLGKSVQRLLAAADIDWEEQFSLLVGDVAAHQIGNVVREIRAWGREALDRVLKNTAEYLQEEVRDLPPSGAVGDFLNAVDTLRSDTDRLEARINRLQQAVMKSEVSK
jgi:ubiquinone biosynthesis protein UbiJ